MEQEDTMRQLTDAELDLVTGGVIPMPYLGCGWNLNNNTVRAMLGLGPITESEWTLRNSEAARRLR